jgi:hypothetical protein
MTKKSEQDYLLTLAILLGILREFDDEEGLTSESKQGQRQ